MKTVSFSYTSVHKNKMWCCALRGDGVNTVCRRSDPELMEIDQTQSQNDLRSLTEIQPFHHPLIVEAVGVGLVF